MKHSQTIGVILCLALFYLTTLSLVTIDSGNSHFVVTGWNAAVPKFGQPGKLFAYIGGLSLLFFVLPVLMVKIFNVFLGAFLVAWSVRNFILLSTCFGDCPQKQWSLYACIIVSVGILIMTFLPKIEIPKSSKK
jgi:hypothetical protein